MKRFFEWLRECYLPQWARQQLVAENQELSRQLEMQKHETMRLEAYIQGMQYALRRCAGRQEVN